MPTRPGAHRNLNSRVDMHELKTLNSPTLPTTPTMVSREVPLGAQPVADKTWVIGMFRTAAVAGTNG